MKSIWMSIITLLLLAHSLGADILVPMTIPQYFVGRLARDIAGFAAAVGASRQENERTAAELKEARVTFWATAVKSPEREAVAERYALALLKKDLTLAAVRLIRQHGAMAKQQGGAITGALLVLGPQMSGGDSLDGGIYRSAFRPFDEWVSCFEGTYAKGERDRGQAFLACKEPYLRYQAVRDANEFLFANPRSPLLDLATTPEDYLGWWFVARALRFDDGGIKAAFVRAKEVLGKLSAAEKARLIEGVRDASFVQHELTVSADELPSAVR